MWVFEMNMPDGTKYTKTCKSEEEAMREMRWAKSRDFYKNCGMSVSEVNETQKNEKTGLFD